MLWLLSGVFNACQRRLRPVLRMCVPAHVRKPGRTMLCLVVRPGHHRRVPYQNIQIQISMCVCVCVCVHKRLAQVHLSEKASHILMTSVLRYAFTWVAFILVYMAAFRVAGYHNYDPQSSQNIYALSLEVLCMIQNTQESHRAMLTARSSHTRKQSLNHRRE